MIWVAVCSWIRATIHQPCFSYLCNWDVVHLIPGVAIRRGPCIQLPFMLFEHGIDICIALYIILYYLTLSPVARYRLTQLYSSWTPKKCQGAFRGPTRPNFLSYRYGPVSRTATLKLVAQKYIYFMQKTIIVKYSIFQLQRAHGPQVPIMCSRSRTRNDSTGTVRCNNCLSQ